MAFASGKKITKKTLIIFDEIQVCPNALNSLKYFCEDAPDYYVVSASSLLGLTLSGGFPVGKVDFIIQTNNNIYPVEAKAGTDVKSSNTKAYLAKYDKTELCIRFSLKNFSYDGKILNIPLYLIDKTDKILELINK